MFREVALSTFRLEIATTVDSVFKESCSRHPLMYSMLVVYGTFNIEKAVMHKARYMCVIFHSSSLLLAGLFDFMSKVS